jgi:hypothetical protein
VDRKKGRERIKRCGRRRNTGRIEEKQERIRVMNKGTKRSKRVRGIRRERRKQEAREIQQREEETYQKRN